VIRNSHRTQGGAFPGRGAAPAITRDFHLPRGQRAGFEKLNDAAAMRPTVMDAGSLVPANDNKRVRLVVNREKPGEEDTN
jgi:hypothetical protein